LSSLRLRLLEQLESLLYDLANQLCFSLDVTGSAQVALSWRVLCIGLDASVTGSTLLTHCLLALHCIGFDVACSTLITQSWRLLCISLDASLTGRTLITQSWLVFCTSLDGSVTGSSELIQHGQEEVVDREKALLAFWAEIANFDKNSPLEEQLRRFLRQLLVKQLLGNVAVSSQLDLAKAKALVSDLSCLDGRGNRV